MKYLQLLLFSFLISLGTDAQVGIITTLAGDGTFGYNGDGGPATAAQIRTAKRGAFDTQGNYYFIDSEDPIHLVRKITPGGIITTVAGTANGGVDADNIPATTALLSLPYDLEIDNEGNILIADLTQNKIRKVDAVTGIITTIAGTGSSTSSGDGGLAINAGISHPSAVTTDGNENIYLIEVGRIRKIDTSGTITTICGNGYTANSGDGGLAINAQINTAQSGIDIDAAGNIYFIAYRRLRKIDPTGTISAVGGNGNMTYNGDNMNALQAAFDATDIALDGIGNLLVADFSNARIRRIDLSSNIITTVSGAGTHGFSGDGDTATNARLAGPVGIAVDTCGSLYIADEGNHRIRKVTYDTCIVPSTNHIVTTEIISLSVYPNPANTQLTITASNLKEISITNTLGQAILQQKAAKEKTTIDIAHLQPGIYFITVTDINGNKQTQKVVKE